MKRDPVENTEEYLAILPELETKIEAALKGVKRGRGFAFQHWRVKKEILLRDYGIEWKSPRELNPRIRFD
jgi:ABC-type Zn uptake system ZnuABC Zn-binding protein ZnuA